MLKHGKTKFPDNFNNNKSWENLRIFRYGFP